MAIQLSVAVRNARLDAIETAIAASGVLKIRTGAAPANCAAADSGAVLGTVALPADWMAAAAAGSKAMAGTAIATLQINGQASITLGAMAGAGAGDVVPVIVSPPVDFVGYKKRRALIAQQEAFERERARVRRNNEALLVMLL